VTKAVTAPIQRSFGTAPFATFTPTPIADEEPLSQEKICYRIKCPTSTAPNAATTYEDQFGSRKVTPIKPYFLCGPARKMFCGDGVVDPGEQCDDGNTKNGDCCSSTCQAEALGASCTDTDGNGCTAAQCDGAGACKQDMNRPAGAACTDTDNNSCTAAQCDGNGFCDQNVFKVVGTGCTDTDGNPCTSAQCDGSGTCVQSVLTPTGTLCPDTDANGCTQAACDTGACQQDFFVRHCTLPAVCNSTNGQCE
jgi:cysteine-rich repeat protein